MASSNRPPRLGQPGVRFGDWVDDTRDQRADRNWSFDVHDRIYTCFHAPRKPGMSEREGKAFAWPASVLPGTAARRIASFVEACWRMHYGESDAQWCETRTPLVGPLTYRLIVRRVSLPYAYAVDHVRREITVTTARGRAACASSAGQAVNEAWLHWSKGVCRAAMRTTTYAPAMEALPEGLGDLQADFEAAVASIMGEGVARG